jgi:CsoR family transcriptional regulator, copper-sensing transcriptional repressor
MRTIIITQVGLRACAIPQGGLLNTLWGYMLERMIDHVHPGYADTKDAQLKRLRRIEGQVRGLQRMVEDETYCIDVLTQVSAVTRALQAVSLSLLEEHLRHCVVDAARESDEAGQAKIEEATAAIARLVRS